MWRGWKKTTTGLLCGSCTTTRSSTAPSAQKSGSATTSTTAPNRQRCSSAPFLVRQASKKSDQHLVVPNNKQEGTACPCCHRRRSSQEILGYSSSCPPPPPGSNRITTSRASTGRGSRKSTTTTITKNNNMMNDLWHQRYQIRKRQRERNQHFLLQKKHLDVSMVGSFYEASKSRHARHRLVLREFDASNAVALRGEVGATGTTTRSSSSRRCRNGTGIGRTLPVVKMDKPPCEKARGGTVVMNV
jgi:hypothetical protein